MTTHHPIGVVIFRQTTENGRERWTEPVFMMTPTFDALDWVRDLARSRGDVCLRFEEASPDIWINNGCVTREEAFKVVQVMIKLTPGHGDLHKHWRRVLRVVEKPALKFTITPGTVRVHDTDRAISPAAYTRIYDAVVAALHEDEIVKVETLLRDGDIEGAAAHLADLGGIIGYEHPDVLRLGAEVDQWSLP